MVANIEIKSKELIRPSSPTPHDRKDYKLSFLDQLLYPVYVPLIFFYQNQSFPNVTDLSKRFRHLKHSLADALAKFYPLAGRIKGNVSVDCNDSGALFVEAHVHASLSQAIQAPVDQIIRYLSFDTRAFLDDAALTDDVPLLAIQITFFDCGGTAVGVCMSHKVADVVSMMVFINHWAALSRHGKKINDSITQPIHDLAFQLFPGVADEDASFPSFVRNRGREKLVTKRFLFNKGKLAALKELASGSDAIQASGSKNLTSVEVLSAFMWKQIIDVSLAKGDTRRMFLSRNTVNLRTKMRSLPSNLKNKLFQNMLGNFIILGTAFSISNPGHGSRFEELLRILKDSIRTVDDDFIKTVQSGAPYLNSLKNAGISEMNCCYISSWCGLPIHGLDYG